MKRRAFVTGLGTMLAAPLGAQAQQTPKTYRIGFLSSLLPQAYAPLIDAFRAALSDLHYVEGRNVFIDHRWPDGRTSIADMTEQLVRRNVDVILTHGASGAHAAKRATVTTPSVIAGVRDPVAAGLVASLARPGGNVTGLAVPSELEMCRMHLRLLKEAVPSASRVALLWHYGGSLPEGMWDEIAVAARRLDLDVQTLQTRDPSDIAGAFSVMTQKHCDALIVLFNPLRYRTHIVNLAIEKKLPTIYELSELVAAGGLMSYGVSLSRLWARAAVFVDKILNGVKPADLPVEQPTKFELFINLKTAKALGLTIPPSLLLRADQVIQ